MNKRNVLLIALALLTLRTVSSADNQIPVAAPMTSNLAGHSAEIAVPSVFRIICPTKQRGGTGFLHKSGKVITAAHVVSECETADITILGVSGKKVHITNIVSDDDLDLALLTPSEKLSGISLPIATNDKFHIGVQVSTWGFPAGYKGLRPLLSSGYLSGIDNQRSSSGKLIPRWVVNAAFNGGNSGGPLLELENGTVIGVVSSKLAPIPPHIVKALEALKSSKGITQFIRTYPDGTQEKVSTGNVVEEVLQYLRSQTQLVIGYAVFASDLRNFLKAHAAEP
jgi:S1-C subfamily serine protease